MQHLTSSERHTQLLKINDQNCLNLSPLSALQLQLCDVCSHSDTHKVFLGQSIKKEGKCGRKEYPVTFKLGSSQSCPKDMNFLFFPVSLKALPCKQEQHKEI